MMTLCKIYSNLQARQQALRTLFTVFMFFCSSCVFVGCDPSIMHYSELRRSLLLLINLKFKKLFTAYGLLPVGWQCGKVFILQVFI